MFSNDLYNLHLRENVPRLPDHVVTRNRMPSETTLERRSQTLRAWKASIFKLIDPRTGKLRPQLIS